MENKQKGKGLSSPSSSGAARAVSKNPLGGMKNVWILTICMFFISVCYTMLVPFLPIYLLELGVSDQDVTMWTGAVFSITFFIAGIMAPVWGKLADKRGKKLMAIRAAAFIGLSYLLCGLVTNAWQLLLARAVMGFANGFMPAAMTIVSLSVAKERTGTALGIFQTGSIVGNVIGPLFGGLLESVIGMRPVFFMAGIILFIVAVVTAAAVKEPALQISEKEKEKSDHTSFREDLAYVNQRPVLREIMILFFIVLSGNMMMHPIMALYVGQLQGTMEGAAVVAGTILSLGGLAGAVTTNLWAHFGQAKGYFKAVSLALLGAGMVLVIQSFPVQIWLFGACQIFVGCCMVGVNPSLSAALTNHTEDSVRGRVFGLATTMQQFGCMMGPLFASAVGSLLGLSRVFLLAGILFFIVGLQLYIRRGRKDHGVAIAAAK